MAKILIIDNTENILKALSGLLSKKGYTVFTASDGAQGVVLAQQHQPDLILLDVNMPGMDGGQVRQALLDNAKTRQIPVVYLTALVTEEEERVQSDLSQGDSYLSKLVDSATLVKKIEETLGKSK